MAKKVQAIVKLQIPQGKPHRLRLSEPHWDRMVLISCSSPKEFNAKTQEQMGLIIPVVLTVYQDRSFSFITKTAGRRAH